MDVFEFEDLRVLFENQISLVGGSYVTTKGTYLTRTKLVKFADGFWGSGRVRPWADSATAVGSRSRPPATGTTLLQHLGEENWKGKDTFFQLALKLSFLFHVSFLFCKWVNRRQEGSEILEPKITFNKSVDDSSWCICFQGQGHNGSLWTALPKSIPDDGNACTGVSYYEGRELSRQATARGDAAQSVNNFTEKGIAKRGPRREIGSRWTGRRCLCNWRGLRLFGGRLIHFTDGTTNEPSLLFAKLFLRCYECRVL